MAVNNTKTSAAILGGAINPLQVYQQYQANKQRNQAAAEKEAKDARDKIYTKAYEYETPEVDDLFKSAIERRANATVRQPALNALDNGESSSKVERNLMKAKSDIISMAAQGDILAGNLKNTYAELKADNEIDMNLAKPYFFDKQDDIVRKFNDGTLDGTETDHSDLTNNSKIYNVQNVLKNFMTALPEKINEHYTKIFGTLGEDYNVQDTKTKLGWQYTTDANGKQSVVVDPRTQQPKVNMTDDVYVQALTNDKLMNIVNDNLGPDANDTQKKAFLTNLLEGLDPKQIKSRIQVGHKKDVEEDVTNLQSWEKEFGSGVGALRNRRDWLDKITSGTRPDLLSAIGNVAKDVSATYGVDPKTKKPVINITYLTGAESDDPNYQGTVGSFLTSGKRSNTIPIPIGTEDEKRAARYKLSEIVDAQLRDTKAAIGTDRYVKYEEAYKDNNKPQKSVADQMRELAGKK